MTAKSMPLVGQIIPTDTVERENDHPTTLAELREIIANQIKERYFSLVEEHFNRS